MTRLIFNEGLRKKGGMSQASIPDLDKCWNFLGKLCPNNAACHYPMSCTLTNRVKEAEIAFTTIFDWIKGGTVVSKYDNDRAPYRWHRKGYEATHMAASPAGEFLHIVGPEDIVAYLKPARRGADRLDLRCQTTATHLIELAATLSRE